MKRTRLVIKGRSVREQPPVVGDYCWPGSTGKIGRPCFYESASCGGEVRPPCQRCGFTYCGNHFPSHIRAMLPMPPDAWKGLQKRLRKALDEIAAHPASPLRAVLVVARP